MEPLQAAPLPVLTIRQNDLDGRPVRRSQAIPAMPGKENISLANVVIL
jgi:hypothetical protein